MFGSEVLDIATGLVLVFLLVSIMLTALSELIEAWFKTRAADLERAIAQLLGDPNMDHNVAKRDQKTADAVEAFYSHSLISALYPGAYTAATKSSWLLFGRMVGNKLPCYIPRELFSATVLDLVKDAARSAPIADVVQKLGAAYGLPGRKAALENWYDGVMDRVSGAYKRRTQKLMFWLGLAIAILFNINPIAITTYLKESPDARRDIVELARRVQDGSSAADKSAPDSTEKIAAKSTSAPASTSTTVTALSTPAPTLCAPNATDLDAAEKCQDAIARVGLPIGWSDKATHEIFAHPYGLTIPDWVVGLLIALVGWTITGLAATLGAPFWFDTLNKVMIVRSTVKPKEKSRDEASADRSEGATENPAVEDVAQQGPATAYLAAGPNSANDGAVG